MSTTGWIFLAIFVIVVLFGISVYNRLVAMRQRVGQAFSDVDVQLKQRHDLVPNLVETVKGYAAHERGTLDEVVRARNAAMAAQGNWAGAAPTPGRDFGRARLRQDGMVGARLEHLCARVLPRAGRNRDGPVDHLAS